MSLCLISLIVRTSSGKRFQAAGPEYKNASSSFGHCRVDHAIYQSINQSIECKRCNSHSISRLSGLVLVVYIVRKLSYLNDIHVNFALCHFRMLSSCFAVQNKIFFLGLTRRNRGGRLFPPAYVGSHCSRSHAPQAHADVPPTYHPSRPRMHSSAVDRRPAANSRSQTFQTIGRKSSLLECCVIVLF